MQFACLEDCEHSSKRQMALPNVDDADTNQSTVLDHNGLHQISHGF
jgi:hypothetical protein